jgi:hypothetical protein
MILIKYFKNSETYLRFNSKNLRLILMNMEYVVMIRWVRIPKP